MSEADYIHEYLIHLSNLEVGIVWTELQKETALLMLDSYERNQDQQNYEDEDEFYGLVDWEEE